MIIDNSILWEKYESLKSEKEKHLFLKDYLLNLPPAVLIDALSGDVDSLGLNIIDVVVKGNLTSDESSELSDTLENIISRLKQMQVVSKAA